MSTVQEFAREHAAYIAILDISASGESAAAEAAAQYPHTRVEFFRVDVSDAAACKRTVDTVAASNGGAIHVLFNNAGFFGSKGMTATPEDFRRSMDVNVAGYATMVQVCVPYMLHPSVAGRASVINNCSISGSRASKDRWTYCSSKGAIKMLTRCMALDLGRKAIRVNCVSPGWIWSPEVDKAAVSAGGGKDKWSARPAHMLYTPLGGNQRLRSASRSLFLFCNFFACREPVWGAHHVRFHMHTRVACSLAPSLISPRSAAHLLLLLLCRISDVESLW